MKRGWKTRRAVRCLLAASGCELVIAAVGLVLLILLRRELTAQQEGDDGVSHYLERMVEGVLPWYVWGYLAAGVVTLAVAALAWRRGGTAGVQAVAALVLVPYTVFYLLFGLLVASVDDYWYVGWYQNVVLSLAGAAGLLYLAGAALLFLAAPNLRGDEDRAAGTPDAVVDVRDGGAVVRGWRRAGAGRAVVCLLAAASGCKLVIAAIALVLLPPLRRELAAGYRPGHGVDTSLETVVSSLQWYVWSYAVAGVVTLAVAVLAWWRAGSAGARAVVVLGLGPYTVLYLLFGLLAPRTGLRTREEQVGWYSDMVPWLAAAAGLLYLAGAILVFFAGAVRHAGRPRAAGIPE
ncbi:hypothetical protein [Streptosporangium amethystogenes]|uniref:hypothetical protein n=1 Tax=Streptosporangium amethystogenes TaxID=2002 RepID=UPI0004C87CE3|nr:hypothetical protein [Streptosporangium amethystogenes]